MPRDDDSFWLSVFRKSPIIGACMAICGLIGLGLGFLLIPPMPTIDLRWCACMLISTSCGGIFVGLIIGVALDSAVSAFRGGNKKKRKDYD
jgi:hypothetical protein